VQSKPRFTTSDTRVIRNLTASSSAAEPGPSGATPTPRSFASPGHDPLHAPRHVLWRFVADWNVSRGTDDACGTHAPGSESPDEPTRFPGVWLASHVDVTLSRMVSRRVVDVDERAQW
jgi:hypothetical protein